MKKVYLTLAIIGAILPYLFFFDFIQVNGFDIPLFITSLFPNGAAGGFSADLLFTSFTFWLFMFVQNKTNHHPSPWLFIILNLTIGLSCAFPAYLYAIEAAKNKAE
ncbi:MAG: DUF2834 domain-containing protein [Pseudomonadales bacterium]|nr:DUF2834 domain-containing protein [Pseudomonadales bacterium]